MRSKLGALALSATLLVALGACAKKDEPAASTTTVSAAAGSSTTAAGGGSTTSTAGEGTTTTKKSSDTTKKSSDTTKKKSTTTAVPANEDLELTDEENDCIDTTIATAEETDDRLKTDENYRAGFIGGVMAQCVDKDKIAAAIIEKVKELNPDASDSVLECAREELVKFDKGDLAIVIAGILLENAELLASADEQIKAKCPGA